MHGQGSTAAAPGDLGGRATHVQVDVVYADLVDHPPHRRTHDVRVDAVQLHAADRLVVVEPDHVSGRPVPFDQRAGRDHLADVEAGAVRTAQSAESSVGHPRHRREDDGRLDRERPDLQHHRSVILTDSCARSRRSRGMDRPMTLLGSPSMPSMNG